MWVSYGSTPSIAGHQTSYSITTFSCCAAVYLNASDTFSIRIDNATSEPTITTQNINMQLFAMLIQPIS
jgi:hypothetical protein